MRSGRSLIHRLKRVEPSVASPKLIDHYHFLQHHCAGVLPSGVKTANRTEHLRMLDMQLLGLFVSRGAASDVPAIATSQTSWKAMWSPCSGRQRIILWRQGRGLSERQGGIGGGEGIFLVCAENRLSPRGSLVCPHRMVHKISANSLL